MPNARQPRGRKLRGRKPGNVHAAARRAKADLDALNTKAQSAMTEHARERLAEKITAAEHGAAAAVLAAAAAPPPEIQANTTDPESRIMKTAAGWVQGFNAPGAVNAGRIVIAADVTQDHNDTHQLTPMMNAVQRNANAAGITEAIGIVVADAGYWSETNATVEGPDRLTATTKVWKQRRKAPELGSTQGPPPAGASHLEAMEHRLRTPEGTATYKLRSHTIEPVFGQIKENRGMR